VLVVDADPDEQVRWEKHTRLELVFALDLQDIEEVGGGSVDFNEVLVRARGRVWEVRHLELMGALRVSMDVFDMARSMVCVQIP
jgi:hypothetical protein